VSPEKYELDFYIPEDGILHSHRRENLKSYLTNLVTVNPDRNTGYEKKFRWLSLNRHKEFSNKMD
jgi:hypothetical protein